MRQSWPRNLFKHLKCCLSLCACPSCTFWRTENTESTNSIVKISSSYLLYIWASVYEVSSLLAFRANWVIRFTSLKQRIPPFSRHLLYQFFGYFPEPPMTVKVTATRTWPVWTVCHDIKPYWIWFLGKQCIRALLYQRLFYWDFSCRHVFCKTFSYSPLRQKNRLNKICRNGARTRVL